MKYIQEHDRKMKKKCPRVKFLCVTWYETPCICCRELEEMEYSATKEEMLSQIMKNMYVEGCPHVVQVLRNKDVKIDEAFLNSYLPHADDSLLEDKRFLKLCQFQNGIRLEVYKPRTFHVRPKSFEPRLRHVLTYCGTTFQHMAIAMRKFDVVKTLVKSAFKSRWDMGKFVRDPDNIYLQNDAKTEFYWLSIYHMAMKVDFEKLFTLRLQHDYCHETFYGCYGTHMWQGIATNFAVERDDLKSLQYLLEISKCWSFKMPWVTPSLMSYTLSYALYKQNKRIVTYLIKQGAVFADIKDEFLPVDSIRAKEGVGYFYYSSHNFPATCPGDCRSASMAIEMVAEKGDLEFFLMMIGCKGFNNLLETGFYFCVVYNQTEKVKYFMKKFKRQLQTLQRKKCKQWFFRDILHRTVMSRHYDMLEILVKGNIKENLDKHDQCNTYSARDWAHLLKFHSGLQLLVKNKFPSYVKDWTKISPLIEILNIDRPTFIREKCIEDLIQNGCDVNFVQDSYYVSPLNWAITRKDYKSVHVLLMNGANPFIKKRTDMSKITEPILKDIFYSNVDLAGHLSEMLCAIIRPEFTEDSENGIGEFIRFTLNSVHTINQDDRGRLRHSLPAAVYVKHQSEIYSFLDDVPALLVLCRNSIRKLCPNKKIHHLVNRENLPSRIKQYLLLKPEFDAIKGFDPPCKLDFE